MVERYKGCDICITKEDQQSLEEDEFYVDDLIGCEVFTKERIGVVKDVREVPQGEILVIETNERDVLIPFRKEFVQQVDIRHRRITLIEWEGLL